MAHHSRWVYVILAAFLTGCNGAGDQQPPPQQQPEPVATSPTKSAPAAPGLVALPAQKLDSIRLEGTAEPITLRLVQPASSMPFVTYVPKDMVVESTRSDTGEAHYFYANFGGKLNKDAFLLIFIYPSNASQQDAVRLAKAFQDTHQQKNHFVDLDLRLHGDRYYYVARQYLYEYADGFGPRAQRILDEWKWLPALPTATP